MFKKAFAVVGTLALALALASCGAKSDEQLMEEGWVKDPAKHEWVKDPAGNGWVKDPASNGWIKVEDAQTKKELPAPRKVAGNDYSYGNSNIHMGNLADYLNRDDVKYIDLRGIDNGYNVEHLMGFEPVEYFNFIQAGAKVETAESKQLFYAASEANVAAGLANKPRYEESVAVLNDLFPKDKTLFLMCASGGRVVSMMKLLEANGYDMNKVYNVGGIQQANKPAPTSSVQDLIVSNSLEANVVVDYFKKTVVENGHKKVVDIELTKKVY